MKCHAGSAPGVDDRQLERRMAGQPLEVARGELRAAGPATPRAARAARCRARPRCRSAGSCSRARPSRRSSRDGPPARSRCRGCGTGAGAAARSSRSVRTAPPSPVVMILAGWRLSTVMSASVPTGRPPERRPERVRGVGDDRQRPARRGVGDRAQGRVVGRLAGVVDRHDRPRPVGDRAPPRRRDRSAGVRVDVGEARLAPAYRTALALATNVIGVVIASSPGPRPATAAAPWSAAVPELNATAWRAPVAPRPARLELRDARAGRQPVGAQGGRDRLDVALVDDLVGVRQQRRADRVAAVDRERGRTRSHQTRLDRRRRPLGHPGRAPARGPRRGRPPASSPGAPGARRRVAAQDRDLALRVDVLDMHDARRRPARSPRPAR